MITEAAASPLGDLPTRQVVGMDRPHPPVPLVTSLPR
jgi:hypothetical protein